MRQVFTGEAIMKLRLDGLRSGIGLVTTAFVVCASFFPAAGCAHHDEMAEPVVAAEPQKEGALPTVVPQPAQTSTTQSTSATLNVGEDLVATCRMKFDSVEQAPKFDFDQSVLSNEDRSVLQQVAQCVTTGPLRGQRLHLVGRADPRGEVEYNMALGENRASSVRDYLISLGVSSSSLNETSRGKLDATGTDEAGWRLDRRVDVDLE
jgi:peptidoglycan-associated lipoprotein